MGKPAPLTSEVTKLIREITQETYDAGNRVTVWLLDELKAARS